MNNFELLPCPFCGGEAEITGGSENWTPTFYDPDSGGHPYCVICKSCKNSTDFYHEVEDVVAAWNKRDAKQTTVQIGEWIYNTDDFTPSKRCSICGYNKPLIAGINVKQEPDNYCPNCGTHMIKEI